jgi:hypothetical protein
VVSESGTDTSGTRIVETVRTRVELVEPWKRAEPDPPLSEWLQLPAGDSCPHCPANHWGTRNPGGYFHVRYCKDCKGTFRPEVDTYTIQEVIGALTGQVTRYWRGDIDG